MGLQERTAITERQRQRRPLTHMRLRGEPFACRPKTSRPPTNSTLIGALSCCVRSAGNMAPRVACTDNGRILLANPYFDSK